jgi:hypothetical protein
MLHVPLSPSDYRAITGNLHDVWGMAVRGGNSVFANDTATKLHASAMAFIQHMSIIGGSSTHA